MLKFDDKNIAIIVTSIIVPVFFLVIDYAIFLSAFVAERLARLTKF